MRGANSDILMEIPMTQERMKNYISLRKEIVLLSQEILIAESDNENNPNIVSGFGKKVIAKLQERKTMYIKECDAIENYILDIKGDSRIRQILTYRYIEGFTLEATALSTGYSMSHVNRIIDTHFKQTHNGTGKGGMINE